MKKRKYGLIVFAIATIIFMLCYIGYANGREYIIPDKINISDDEEAEVSSAEVVVWYTDDSLKNYLNAACESYFKKTGVSAAAIKVSSMEYVERINETNVNHNGAPDLVVSGSENIEKLYLAGIYKEIPDTDVINEDNYPEVALNAAYYKDKLIAYPLNYNTCIFAYNKDYVEKEPATIDDIIEFSNNYVTKEDSTVQNVLRWDCKNLLDNYMYIGNYLHFGGEDGLDSSIIDLNNDKAVEALSYYQSLATIFSIDINKVSPIDIAKEFSDEKNIYSVIEASCIPELEKCDFDYGLMKFPDITASIKSKSLSETNVMLINPYNGNSQKAAELARFLCFENADKMYETGGIQSCRDLKIYGDDYAGEIAMEQYKETTGLPKFRITNDYWLMLQNTLNKAWTGDDPKELLDGLQKQIEKKF